MSAAEIPLFPPSFLIGAATAAHQIEGNNVNADLWDAEWTRNSIFREPSGDTCDSYHRYGEDISLLAAAGLDTYRFGVEWARIEPEDGFFSRAELDHYRRVAATCHEHGVTPMITLQHFTSPKWFARRGGWKDAGAAERFARFAERVAAHLGDLVPWVCTINEANISALGHGEIAGGAYLGTSDGSVDLSRDDRAAPLGGFPNRRVEVMARAHVLAVEAYKSVRSDVQMGWTLALLDLQAVDGGEELRDEKRRVSQLDFLDVSRNDDFVGVQTYSRAVIGPEGEVRLPEGTPQMQTGWEVYPEALGNTVRLAAEHSGRPVFVTENGVGTNDDEQRIAVTSSALESLRACIDDGIDVRGYLHWTLLDNFEWMAGYAMTFGLIEVDRETFERKPKPSLAWLGRVAKARR
ncbi:MAG: glycoside hydrolase family 1 protein [Chloroflexota bacterium]